MQAKRSQTFGQIILRLLFLNYGGKLFVSVELVICLVKAAKRLTSVAQERSFKISQVPFHEFLQSSFKELTHLKLRSFNSLCFQI